MNNSIKMDTPCPESLGTSPCIAADPGNPPSGLKSDFENAVREQNEDVSGECGDKTGENEASQAMPSASSVLGTLFENKMKGTAAPLPTTGNLNELTDIQSQERSNTRLRDSADPLPIPREDFEKTAHEKYESGSGKHEDKAGEDGPSQALPSADSLLGSLFDNKMNTITGPPPAAANLDELVDVLVQRILVSDPQSGSPTEIRLQINASVLLDTQVVLRRRPDGLLNVLLETGNTASMQTLVFAQSSLREHLEKHGPVNVRVSSADESGQSDNDANRRSRGWVNDGLEIL